jgi:hypothetical protein
VSSAVRRGSVIALGSWGDPQMAICVADTYNDPAPEPEPVPEPTEPTEDTTTSPKIKEDL